MQPKFEENFAEAVIRYLWKPLQLRGMLQVAPKGLLVRIQRQIAVELKGRAA